jgi:hypothetical protein
MLWLWISVAAWVLITNVAVAYARATAKPWPKQQERYRK